MKEKGLFPATGKKPSMSLSTTYYCIQLYEFPITVEIRHGLLSVQPATQERFSTADVLASGSHHPRIAFAFLSALLSPSAFFLYEYSFLLYYSPWLLSRFPLFVIFLSITLSFFVFGGILQKKAFYLYFTPTKSDVSSIESGHPGEGEHL